MKVGLVDIDNTGFPNIALGKLAAYHKRQGDTVEWAEPLFKDSYDVVYKSKVFRFSLDLFAYPREVKGGSGYAILS